MDVGLGMHTHGLVARGDHEVTLADVPAAELRLVEACRLAERAGFHSLWFGDHVVMAAVDDAAHPANDSGRRAYLGRPSLVDQAVAMATAASATERVGIASSVLIAPYRHPLAVAHQYASLDVISGGRLIFGVSAGWSEVEFRALGVAYEERGAITAECLEIYRLAWTQDVLEFHGRFFDFAGVTMDPKPLQQPHPPILYGAVSEAGARRAARLCDGLYPILLDPRSQPGRFDHLVEAARREADAIGRDLAGFRLACFVSGRVEDAPRAGARPLLAGSAEQLLDDLSRLAERGYGHATIYPDVPSGSVAEFLETVDRLGREVLPQAAAIRARTVF